MVVSAPWAAVQGSSGVVTRKSSDEDSANLLDDKDSFENMEHESTAYDSHQI